MGLQPLLQLLEEKKKNLPLMIWGGREGGEGEGEEERGGGEKMKPLEIHS